MLNWMDGYKFQSVQHVFQNLIGKLEEDEVADEEEECSQYNSKNIPE